MAKMMIEVYQCEICKGAILGSMVGFGNGSGDKFVHLHCWEAFQQSVHSDAGDSAVSTSSLQASAESTFQTVTQPTQRG